MLSRKALEDFKKIWRRQFGEDIPDEKATDEAISILTLFNAIYRPVKKSWLKEIGENSVLPRKSDQSHDSK